MRETRFIEQNKKKWEEFEQMLSTEDKDPNKLSDLFVQITDDLSFARTFYPNRSVRYYLNNLAQQIFYNINKGKKNGLKNFKEFWTLHVPKVVYDSRKELLLSLIIFIISVAIGVFSSITDKEFIKSILGESYVKMTMENINSGDPMAVYKKSNQFDMFLSITVNNLLVAFRTFVMGIFFSVGTLLIMLHNGIMIGAFQYFFIEKGLFVESFLTIWLHGTLEISSIIIAGGAGLKLGSGLIFPGTYSRLQAFKISGRKGLIIMMSTVPIFIFAALIEGFVTRYTHVHFAVRLGLILISLTFIVGYYIILPFIKSRDGSFDKLGEEKLSPSHDAPVDFKAINNNAEIFSQNFVLYKNFAGQILKWILPVSILYTIVATYFLYLKSDTLTNTADYFFIFQLFQYKEVYGVQLAILNFISFSIVLFLLLNFLSIKYHPETRKKTLINRILQTVIVSLVIQLSIYMNPLLIVLFIIFVLPMFFIWLAAGIAENKNIAELLSRALSLGSEGYGRLLGLAIVLMVSTSIYFLLLGSPFTYIYYQAIEWNILLEEKESLILRLAFSTFISITALNLILPLFLYGYYLAYFTVREIKDASYLKERILTIGTKSKNAWKA